MPAKTFSIGAKRFGLCNGALQSVGFQVIFLAQILTPILFYYHGSVLAGRLGMSMTICNMLFLFAMTFMSAHNPELCQLIAQKKWDDLQAVFKRVFWHSFVLTLIAAAFILILMLVPALQK